MDKIMPTLDGYCGMAIVVFLLIFLLVGLCSKSEEKDKGGTKK